jgi:hypothetical protein
MAQIRLPLKINKLKVDVGEAFNEMEKTWRLLTTYLPHKKSQWKFLKNLLMYRAVSVGKRYKSVVPLALIRDLKTCSKYLIMAITNVIVKLADAASRKKEEIYANAVKYDSITDIISALSTKPFYCAGQKVKIYYVTSRTSSEHVLDECDAQMLNNGAVDITHLYKSPMETTWEGDDDIDYTFELV